MARKPKKAKIESTRENLQQIGGEILTRWLITAANERSVMTYGEAKRRLEQEHGFSTIFSTMMGHPAGAAMDHILAVDPKAPLLNVLLVQQADGMPGFGAGPYLARHFKKPVLGRKDTRKRNPKLWRECFERAAEEVYAYRDWDTLYKRVYGQKYQPDPEKKKRSKGKDGTERDGLPRGRSGEGKNHKALRLWVTDNPRKVLPRQKVIRTDTEVELFSGDRVDSVYYGTVKTVAIEVKSRDSNEADLQRGIFQCVKYRAVLKAMDARHDAPVNALLVTESPLNSVHRELARRLNIWHFIAPRNRGN